MCLDCAIGNKNDNESNFFYNLANIWVNLKTIENFIRESAKNIFLNLQQSSHPCPRRLSIKPSSFSLSLLLWIFFELSNDTFYFLLCSLRIFFDANCLFKLFRERKEKTQLTFFSRWNFVEYLAIIFNVLVVRTDRRFSIKTNERSNYRRLKVSFFKIFLPQAERIEWSSLSLSPSLALSNFLNDFHFFFKWKIIKIIKHNNALVFRDKGEKEWTTICEMVTSGVRDNHFYYSNLKILKSGKDFFFIKSPRGKENCLLV